MKNSIFRGFSFVPGFLAIVFALSIGLEPKFCNELEKAYC
jgi:hypothetical protein